MTVNLAHIGSLDLGLSPYSVSGAPFAPDLPPAQLSEFGRAAQMAGSADCPAHYDDAPWELTVNVAPTTDAAVDALKAAFIPGAVLTWGEDGRDVADTTLRTVSLAAAQHFASFSRLTFSGTRAPAWRVTIATFSGTILGGSGTLTLPAVTGSTAAEISLFARCAAASKFIAVAVADNPRAGFDPVDDYSGVADAAAFGGAWSPTAALSATPAIIGTAPTVSVGDNRGTHLVCARVKCSGTPASNSYQVGSTIGASTVWEPPVKGVATPEGIALGRIQIPPRGYSLPSAPTSEIWGAAAPIEVATGGEKSMSGITGFKATYQPVNLTEKSRIRSYGKWLTNGAASPQTVEIRLTSSAGGSIGVLASATVTIPAHTTMLACAACDVEHDAGTVYLRAYFDPSYVVPLRDASAPYSGAAGYVYGDYIPAAGDGTDSTIDWKFQVLLDKLMPFDSTTLVRATGTGTTQIDHLVRLPQRIGTVMAAGTFGAGGGIFTDENGTYPVDGVGITGTELPASRTGSLSAVPGVENRLVVFCDSVATVTISGEIHQQRI